MTLAEAIALIESYLDYEQQTGRMDEELLEAFDVVLALLKSQLLGDTT